MKTQSILSIIALLAGSLVLTQAAAKDDVLKGIKALANASNYSWKSTSESAGGRGMRGPTTGVIAKDGAAVVTRPGRDDTPSRSVFMGDKAATETQDGWMSRAELESNAGDNRGRFGAMRLRNFEPPTKQAEELLKGVSNLALKDGAYVGKLTEEGAKGLLTFGGRGGNQQGPDIQGAGGTVSFWLKNGMLAKYQYSLKGTMSFNGNEREMDRTTTVEISAVGTTKVEVPAAAKAKL